MIDKNLEQVVLTHLKDNVVTAKSVIRVGTLVEFAGGKKIKVRDEIPFAHKIALRKILKGGGVIKYGERIGKATRVIQPGELVHIHNVVGERGKGKKK
jgi:altronate dehydratase small subunit